MLITAVILHLFSANTFGQSPHSINYQAVARDAETGEELVNQSVFLVAKIIQTAPNGELVYQEEHPNITTNEYGLFSMQIGNGDQTFGNFADINWGSNSFWLEIDMDLGDGLETMGSMQFVSVPYALHAETVANPDDADADPTNELIQNLSFDPEQNNLVITQGDQEYSVNLESLVNDADADPTNELIQDISYNSSDSSLTIMQGDQELSVNLGQLINDEDADPENEAISNFSLEGDFLILNEQEDWAVNMAQFYEDADADPANELISEFNFTDANHTLSVTEGGLTNTVDLSPLIDDADADPTNEAIPNNGLNLLNDTILQITEGSTTHELNLANLRDDGDWTKSQSGENLYNTDQRIGINTSNPTSSLDIKGSLAYSYTILDNTEISTYNVQEDDYLLVFRMTFGFNDLYVELPNASTCPGRAIELALKGSLTPSISVNFSGSQLNFGEPIPYSFGSFLDYATRFLSLGDDGWIIVDV